MNEFATLVGWIVIIGFILFVIGSVAESIKNEKNKELENRLNIKMSTYRIAARHIYQHTSDPIIQEKVKRYANEYLYGWASLELEMSDEEFIMKNARLGAYEAEM